MMHAAAERTAGCYDDVLTRSADQALLSFLLKMILTHATYLNTSLRLPFSNIWTVHPRSLAAAMGTTLTLTSGAETSLWAVVRRVKPVTKQLQVW